MGAREGWFLLHNNYIVMRYVICGCHLIEIFLIFVYFLIDVDMNSGSSRDWVKGVHNINVTYTIEFRDKEQYGFLLPPDQILPNSLEMYDGVKAIVKESRALGYL